jgi:hypothetical protein
MDKLDDDVRRLTEIWRRSRELAQSANPMARDCANTVLAEVRATLRLVDPLAYETEESDRTESRSS